MMTGKLKSLRPKPTLAALVILLATVGTLAQQGSSGPHESLKGLFDDMMGAGPDSSAAEGDVDPEANDDGLPVLMQSGLLSGLEGGASAFLTPIEVLSEKEIARAVPWRAPDYKGQGVALGWSENVFEVPEKLKTRVAFWREIYSRYTTDQGLLHDTTHVDIIYEPIDFTPIMRDPTRSAGQKAKMREALVNARKKAITERLLRLQARLKAGQGAAGLVGEDLRVWRMFEKVSGKLKFKEAAHKKRLRFQLGQKDRFILGIFYSGRYLHAMEEIFKNEGLPIELTRLPFVESSFNIHARSKVGASGIWQFMPRTAKEYLTVTKAVDERNDPLRATLASARLLKQNYMMLESWPLAITGYNHGAYGVKAIVNKLGTRDISEIVERYSSKSFGFASENFYACFLAALTVEYNARTYFGDVKWSGEIPGHELKVTQPTAFTTLVRFFDGDLETAALLNPHLQAKVRDGKDVIPRGTFVRVPPERARVAGDFFAGKVSYAELSPALEGAPLSQNAAAIGATAQALPPPISSIRKRLAKLSAVAGSVFPVLTGQTPVPPQAEIEPSVARVDEPVAAVVATSEPVPAVEPVAAAPVGPAVEPAAQPAVEPTEEPRALRTYRVRSGDSLLKIAKKHGVDLAELRELNGLPRKGVAANRIRPGQLLKVPDRKRVKDRESSENE